LVVVCALLGGFRRADASLRPARSGRETDRAGRPRHGRRSDVGARPGTCSSLRRVSDRLDISTKHCIIERDGPVVTLTMNRPEKRNALSPDMLAGLVLGYEYVDDHADVRCAILTGAGGSFCSGMDLASMGQQSDDPKVQAVMARGDNPHWKALLRDYRLSKPLIAAVEGYAVAGGSELLQGTDLRVAGAT